MYGDMIPMKKVDDSLVEKTQADFDERDKIMISKNAKANNYFICGLDRNIYNMLIKHLVLMKYGDC